MDLIKLFLLGASGYLLLGLFDVAQIKQHGFFSRVLGVGFLVTTLPYFIMLVRYESPHLSFVRSTLLILAIAAALATLYVAALEILLCHTDATTVYAKGSYARIRHPGFLLHLGFNALFSLYLFRWEVAGLCLLFVLCNLALVIVEDRVLFPRLFADYSHYKKTTGLLLPKRRGHR